MDPLLATGLLSLGRTVIDRVLPDPTPTAQTSAAEHTAFARQLEAAQRPTLSQWLETQGVGNREALPAAVATATQALRADPAWAGRLPPPGEPLLVSWQTDGSLLLQDGQGRALGVTRPGQAGDSSLRRLGELLALRDAAALEPQHNLSTLSLRVQPPVTETRTWSTPA